MPTLRFIQILGRDIVFRNFSSGHSLGVRVRGVLDRVDELGFGELSLLRQFADTF